MLDLVLRGGTVIDGTGAARRVADVGVLDGRVVAVGAVDERGEREEDVTGLVVSPGFVDIHTHYDAQLFWDPVASPSSLHGVTTVFAGNCGFGIAPMSEEHVEYVASMLAAVEGMSRDVLLNALDWKWSSFGSWLGRLDGSIGPNAGFLIGHSTLRRFVMGEAAVGEAASPEALRAMAKLLRESLHEGAIGFSSSWNPAHTDGAFDPVPSRSATLDELMTLAEVTGAHPGTVLEFSPGIAGMFGDEEVGAMVQMSRVANRPINWNVIRIQRSDEALVERQLSYGSGPDGEGARIVALTFPDTTYQLVSPKFPGLWSSIPGWDTVMSASIQERIELFRRPDVRERLRRGGLDGRRSGSAFVAALSSWETLRFAHIGTPRHAGYVGRMVGDVAAERGQDAFDTVMDISADDSLETYFELSFAEEARDDQLWHQRAKLWKDERIIVGASDAGAHLDISCGARYTTGLLGIGVREKQLLSLEDAVRLITDVPARFYGVRDRGRISEGSHADLVVFDPDEIGYEPIHMQHDFPLGTPRLTCEPTGIERVIVNGRELVRDGAYTGDLPGAIVRPQDLETQPVR